MARDNLNRMFALIGNVLVLCCDSPLFFFFRGGGRVGGHDVVLRKRMQEGIVTL